MGIGKGIYAKFPLNVKVKAVDIKRFCPIQFRFI